MKNQALTTTLAVLLAVSLSALVALVVSTDALGNRTAIAEAPAAVLVNPANPVAPLQAATPATAAPTTPAAPANGDDTPAPTNPETADTPDVVETPEAPAAPDMADAPADDEPADVPEAPDTPDAPADDEPADAPAEDPDAPEMPEPPADDDEPETGEPPCDGVIVAGECVPPISILCQLGYDLIGDDCVFVGCPNGFKLAGDFCVPLGLASPCPDGQVRVGDLCLLVLDPVIVEPLCGPGLKLVEGSCVSVCPADTMWVAGFCLPEIGFDFDSPVLPDLDFSAGFGG